MCGRQNIQRIIRFIIVFAPFSRSQSDLFEHNKWEDYHSSCPYNNFCTRNATKITYPNETHLVSCCQECSCDPDCQKFGVCCPDYNLVAGIDVLYPCVLLDDYFNYPRGIDQDTKFNLNYHIIDDCQLSVQHRNQCEVPVHLEDFVLVSDITNGHVYKNKHCALCHGVKDYEEWGIVTTCEDIVKLSFETFEERDEHIIKYCSIVPYPPPSQAKSLYRCINSGSFNIYYEKCGYVDDTFEVDVGIVSSCERHTPYTNARIYYERWFKNIYCFWCNKKTEFNQHLCKDFSLMYIDRPGLSFTMLLETRIRPSDSSERCNTSSIFDPYTESCLRLFCSPGSIPSSGKCRSVSRDPNDIEIATVFKVELNGSTEMYGRELLASFHSNIASTLGNKTPCETFYDAFGVNSIDVFLISFFVTHGNCTRDYFMSNMLGFFNNSISVKFVYLNTTVEAKLTSSSESHEMITMFSNPTKMFGFGWRNVFRSCARIDRRMVPMLMRINPDTMFQGKMVDNKVCVRDYTKHAELMRNAMCTLKQNVHVLIFNILILFFFGPVLN